MKVGLTGGTGFVGSEVLRQLHQAGHQARLLVRDAESPSAKRIASKFSVELCAGNILAPERLGPFCKGCDAVIHLVGIISEMDNSTFENIHTRGTGNVVKALQTSGVPRLVHMSALGSRPNAVSRYHRTKWQAEETVRNSGLEFTNFRPPII